MKTVLLSAPYMIPIRKRIESALKKYGIELIVPIVHERLDESGLLKIAGQFDAAICGDDHFTARVLEASVPRLKVISKWGTGIDTIDSDACARLGVKLFRTPNAFTLPVSDSVIGYMLAFARNLPGMDATMKSGKWKKTPGKALHECTLGVIGVGTIGKVVTRKARAFGMRVLGNDIVEIDHVFIAETGIKMTPLDTLLAESDFVSVNCDLNPTSHHLINSRTLGLMLPAAILINTARGSIVNEPDLVEALKAGKIGGAALDVFEVEPLPAESELRKMDNVMLAPHNSNSSPAAWERVHLNTLRNLLIGMEIQFSENQIKDIFRG
jgi:D-3-phosphoglycerate dehydrogenase / 2-oxoglutarate reductase